MPRINTLSLKTTALALAGAATLFAAPAHAVTKKDVQKCRDAATQETSIDMSDYRLRFVNEKGNRNRVITFKAIPHNSGESFEFTCNIKRANVEKITLLNSETQLLAQNETAKK